MEVGWGRDGARMGFWRENGCGSNGGAQDILSWSLDSGFVRGTSNGLRRSLAALRTTLPTAAALSLERLKEPNDPAMGRKWPRCQASDRSAYLNDTPRSDNDADGPFAAHPKGDTLFARPRRRSSSATHSSRIRRRSLMAGENRVVAGSLGSFRRSRTLSVGRDS